MYNLKNFVLKDIQAYTNDCRYIECADVLVDSDNSQLIWCTYGLQNSKDIGCNFIDCKLVSIPITQISDDLIDISWNMLIHKLNSGDFIRVDYTDLMVTHNDKKFSVFM